MSAFDWSRWRPAVQMAAMNAATYDDDDVARGTLRYIAREAGHPLDVNESAELIRAAREEHKRRKNGKPVDAPANGRRATTDGPSRLRFAADFDALTSDTAEALLQRKLEPVDALPTFLRTWSNVCRDEGGGIGLAAPWMVTAGAASGKGKSLFGANQAVSALRAGWSMAMHSAEMSQSQLFTRTLAIGSGEPVRLLEHGRGLDPDAHRRAARAFDEIRERTGAKLYANRRQIHDLAALEDSIRHAHDALGCRFHVVDYLQLYAVDQNDPASITAVSHRAMRLAQELNVVVLSLSQFNRSTSANPERPSIHGLLGGSAIENDSDQVLLIDHSRMERAPAPEEGWYTYILIGKNRHGPLVDIPVHFDTTTLRIRERLPDELPARGA